MKDLGRLASIVCLFLGLAVVITKPAYAYLDPGTGSFIIQIIIGGVVAAGAALKIYWGKIRGFFVKKERKS